MASRRAVAPVIATLLLVAIAVVGGSIIFVFSQGFFSSAQISGAPQIESLEIVGYDMSDGEVLQMHDGFCTSGGTLDGAGGLACVTNADFDGNAGDGLLQHERFAVYVQNQSVNDLVIADALLAGEAYSYVATAPLAATLLTAHVAGGPNIAPGSPLAGEFNILTRGDDTAGTNGILKVAPTATLEPGESATLLFAINNDVPIGRDAQLKLTTANGNVFVTTLIAGQQSG